MGGKTLIFTCYSFQREDVRRSLYCLMCNMSLVSLVNKSQVMSRAFYKMQGNGLSIFFFIILYSWETMTVPSIEKISSFLTQLIDVAFFHLSIFSFQSHLRVCLCLCVSQEIRFCVSRMLHVRMASLGHLRYYFWKLF